jgi:hypothetical protein
VQEVPVVVEASFLLFSLNEYLSRTALLVQPLHLPPDSDEKDLTFVDIPLPLPQTDQPLIGGIATSRCPTSLTCILTQRLGHSQVALSGEGHTLGARDI